MNTLPIRKHPRLKNYDYSQNGCYFVTICVADFSVKLSDVIEENENEKPSVILTETGMTVEKYILSIPDNYNTVSVDKYIILPNHIHLLLSFDNTGGGMRSSRPTENTNPQLHNTVRAFKRMVTQETGKTIFQDSFYDEVIKNEEHYLQVWQYIESNAQKWIQKHSG